MSTVRFDEALSVLATRIADRGVSLRAVVPTPDGHLLFALRPSTRDLLWISTEGEGKFSLNGRPVLPRPGAQDAEVDETLERVAEAFSTLPGSYAPLFDARNREVTEVPGSATGLLSLMAAIVTVGCPTWGSWILEAPCDEPPSEDICLAFSSGSERVVCAFSPAGGRKPERALVQTPLGSLVVIADTRTPASRERLLNQPERVAAYALATGIHAGMRWGEPARQSETGTVRKGKRSVSAADFGASHGNHSDRRPRAGEWLKRSLNHGFAAPDHFFSGYGNEDLLYLGMIYSSGVDTIGHGGCECPVGMPLFPELVGGRASAPWRLIPPADRNTRHTISGVDDRSVVKGGGARLKEQLDAKSESRLVLLTTHCEYEYIGDQTEQIADQHSLAAHGRLVRLHTPMPRFVRQSGDANWWRPIVRRIPAIEEIEPRSVNLVGFAPHGDRGLKEIESLLATVDIHVRACFFPTFDVDELNLFSGAQATVLRPWQPVRDLLHPLFQERGFTYVAPPAPYGPSATRAWLDAVAGAAGASAPIRNETWASILAQRAGAWADLQSRARGIRVAFVVPETYLREVSNSAFLYGIDMIAFLSEAGFDVNVLVAPGVPEHPDDAAWLPRKYPGVRIVRVPSAQGVSSALREVGARLVYSELPENPVAAAAGAFPFGPQMFEMGLEGACRTVSRLLSLSRSDFFERFSRFSGDRR